MRSTEQSSAGAGVDEVVAVVQNHALHRAELRWGREMIIVCTLSFTTYDLRAAQRKTDGKAPYFAMWIETPGVMEPASE